MEGGRGDLENLTGKTIGRRPLGMSRHRWEDNVKMDLKNRFQYMGLD